MNAGNTINAAARCLIALEENFVPASWNDDDPAEWLRKIASGEYELDVSYVISGDYFTPCLIKKDLEDLP